MNRMLLAIAIVLSVIGIGALGTQIGTTSLTLPQPIGVEQASAACTIAIGAPAWNNGGYRGFMSAQGCGSVTLQSCLQNTVGTVYACVTWSGVGANKIVASGVANLAYCQQRTWGWSSVYGTWVSAYRILC